MQIILKSRDVLSETIAPPNLILPIGDLENQTVIMSAVYPLTCMEIVNFIGTLSHFTYGTSLSVRKDNPIMYHCEVGMKEKKILTYY